MTWYDETVFTKNNFISWYKRLIRFYSTLKYTLLVIINNSCVKKAIKFPEVPAFVILLYLADPPHVLNGYTSDSD